MGQLLQLVGLRITGRIRATARTRKGADAGQVSPWSKQLMTRPEPKDKLGTPAASTGGDMFAVPVNVVVVNGPKDDLRDWDAISWRDIEQDVRRLTQQMLTGLLEPDAVKVARPVLRGAQQCARPTRPSSAARCRMR